MIIYMFIEIVCMYSYVMKDMTECFSPMLHFFYQLLFPRTCANLHIRESFLNRHKKICISVLPKYPINPPKNMPLLSQIVLA